MHGGAAGIAFIPLFATAAVRASVIARASRKRWFGDTAALLFAESGVLWLTAVAGFYQSEALARTDTAAITLVGSIAVVAMGMQNGMMRESFGGQVPTTVMTGNVTQLSLDLLELWRVRRTHAELQATLKARIRKASAALMGFVFGAAAGAGLESSVGMASVVVPASVLLVLAAIALSQRLRERPLAQR